MKGDKSMRNYKKYNSSIKGRARVEKYRRTAKGKESNRRYMYSPKGIAARKRAMKKYMSNTLKHKGYREQVLECDKNGDRFIIKAPYASREILVCIKHKTYCHSKACIKERLI